MNKQSSYEVLFQSIPPTQLFQVFGVCAMHALYLYHRHSFLHGPFFLYSWATLEELKAIGYMISLEGPFAFQGISSMKQYFF